MSKRRLTVTVDDDVVEVASSAVAAGQAESLSSWVNEAMAQRAIKERRLAALAELVAGYEAEFGEITAEELEAQVRADQDAAAAVRLGVSQSR
ncbi:MAG: hypothetical protein S0880_15985 [Actinomycetota bacterium]|nr:hypothetical protein [Actinomycetota bacterium]